MPGNVKALTPDEMRFVLNKYKFEAAGDYIIVRANNRSTAHPSNKGFSLLLPLERRRVKITPKAIAIWEKNYVGKYSLLEVQNAINVLTVTLQPASEDEIGSQLIRARSKIMNAAERQGENNNG